MNKLEDIIEDIKFLKEILLKIKKALRNVIKKEIEDLKKEKKLFEFNFLISQKEKDEKDK